MRPVWTVALRVHYGPRPMLLPHVSGPVCHRVRHKEMWHGRSSCQANKRLDAAHNSGGTLLCKFIDSWSSASLAAHPLDTLFRTGRAALCVRGLFFATVQYSSLCVGAVVLTLGGDDMEAGVPDREQVDCEREKVEVRDEEKGDKTRTSNARSNM